MKSQLLRLRDREQYQMKLRSGNTPTTPSRSAPHWLFFLLATLLGLAVGALLESRVGVMRYAPGAAAVGDAAGAKAEM